MITIKEDSPMRPNRLHPACLQCLTGKQLPPFLEGQPREMQLAYMQRVLKLLSEAPATAAAPVLSSAIGQIRKEMFGYAPDYTEIKKHFNQLMLDMEAGLMDNIRSAKDPLLAALQYAMVGNYVDFGALKSVEEGTLQSLLSSAGEISVEAAIYESLKKDLLQMKTLVYLTDNCGEIVLDKLLVRIIRELNPAAEVTVVVRGQDIVNDATMEDALQVGMPEVARVIGNGAGIAGTWMDAISEEARQAILSADVILSKGQGNFETLCECGLNIYYLFLCKCDMFARRFRVPKLTGMLLNDRDIAAYAME